MPCPDPRHCPQPYHGRCLFLLGTAATHAKIRSDCDRIGRVPEHVVAGRETLIDDPETKVPAQRCVNDGTTIICGEQPRLGRRCALCGRNSTTL